MAVTWIVAANAGRVVYFEQPKSGAALAAVEHEANPATRLRASDTETDDLGRRSGSARTTRGGTPSQPSGYEPHQTPAEHQSELFARGIATTLQHARDAGRFTEIVLIASPEFLGVLRKQLGPLASAVRLEIHKDYTHLTAAELRERLDAHATSP